MPKISGEKTFKKPYPWLQKPSHKAVASFPSPARLKKPNKSKANFFFPRVRTPCGRCAQVIIERKGNTTDDGEKNTRKPPKSTQPEPQTTNKQKRPEAVSPSSKQCFLCTEVRQVKKDWLRTIYGPEFTTKVCQEGQRTGEEQCEASQRGFVPSKL